VYNAIFGTCAALATYIFCKIQNDGRANSIFSFPFDGDKQWNTGDRYDTFLYECGLRHKFTCYSCMFIIYVRNYRHVGCMKLYVADIAYLKFLS
jgi:hypothetical protein